MTIPTEVIVVRSEGQSVDGIVWHRYRWPMPGILEMTLDMNPGLAGLGTELPVGTTFNLPIVDPRDLVPEHEVVTLWK